MAAARSQAYLQAPYSSIGFHPSSGNSLHARVDQFRPTPPMANSLGHEPNSETALALSCIPTPSFFEEALCATPDHPIIQAGMSSIAFRPQWPAEAISQANTIAPSVSDGVGNSTQLPAPGVLATHVDASQYTSFDADEWTRASVEYDAPSLSSISTPATSPLTPSTEQGGFEDYFWSTGQQVHNATAPDYLVKYETSHFSTAVVTSDDTTLPCYLVSNGTYVFHTNSNASASGHFGLHLTAHRRDKRLNIALQPDIKPNSIHINQPQSAFNDLLARASPESEHTACSGRGKDLDFRDEFNISDSSVSNDLKHRQARDVYLLEMRKKGVSYKDIKRRGRYREAESTLRGRMRVLTKAKSERVRKPEWTLKDVELLRRSVESFTERLSVEKSRTSNRGLPWKRIGIWIKHNGGSYLFAPATCAKKWDELNDGEA